MLAPPRSLADVTLQVTTISSLEEHSAHNYSPLPVVIAEADDIWVTDIYGTKYLDALSGYSALNFGHRHPTLVNAVRAQLDRVTLTSRAFHHDRFAQFCTDLSRLTGKDAILPMNTGAEAVETAIKAARRWGHQCKGVPVDQGTIIVAENNFHGRTTTIVGFSTDPDSRSGFGPFTPGFRSVPFGDIDRLEALIDDNTIAVLLEPIQGEAGVIIPPAGYLAAVRTLTAKHNVLLIADEIQAGLGRTGATFACDHEAVVPDIFVLGKALGGGILPVSAIAADWDVMEVFTPGSHGSTFGGNPLACAVGSAVVSLLETGEYQERSRVLGKYLEEGLRSIESDLLVEIRCIGLWAGVQFAPDVSAKKLCLSMMKKGVLAKDTQQSTVRIAPPLTIRVNEVDLLVTALDAAVKEYVGA
jgi:ornithine--oxo-acid transaminase